MWFWLTYVRVKPYQFCKMKYKLLLNCVYSQGTKCGPTLTCIPPSSSPEILPLKEGYASLKQWHITFTPCTYYCCLTKVNFLLSVCGHWRIEVGIAVDLRHALGAQFYSIFSMLLFKSSNDIQVLTFLHRKCPLEKSVKAALTLHNLLEE